MSIQPGTGYTFTSSSQGTNFSIQTPWAPIPLYQETFECSPFLVHDVKYNTGEGGSYVTYEICPGVINNLMPGVYDTTSEAWQPLDALPEDYKLILDFGGTSSCFVYLRVGPNSVTKVFPSPTGESPEEDNPYPKIYSTGAVFPDDTNTLAYVKIAKVTALSAEVYRVDQYITGSLWGDRIQIGAGETMTSYYYYARV
jgi:hypothetical protein